MADYILPQSLVYQEVSRLPFATTGNLNSLVYGGHYELFRFDNAAEKALLGVGSYMKDADTEYAYPGKTSTATIDEVSVRLFAEDVLAEYYEAPSSSTTPIAVVGDSESNKLRAVPRIGTVTSPAGKTTVTVKGAHIGMVALPEQYTFTPAADFTIGTDAGVLNYVTTEGLTGTVAVPADALNADVDVIGPHGLVLDFDTGTSDDLVTTDEFTAVVLENDYVWATGNGVSRYAAIPREVAVGDSVQWTATTDSGVESGISKIQALEADYSLPTFTEPVAADSNKSSQAEALGALTAGDDNNSSLAGVVGLASSASMGSYAKGLTTKTYTLTVTTAGDEDSAVFLVTDTEGNSTTVTSIGSVVYIGDGIEVDFADGVHNQGNVYTVESTNTLVAATAITSGGVYGGTQDNVYSIEVVRGGVFTRAAAIIDYATSDATVTADLSNWVAGDVDDEYILQCTAAGATADARFSLTSRRGDNVTLVNIPTSGVSTKTGSAGLYLTVTDGSTEWAVGDTVVIIVKAARPLVRISDAKGSDQVTTLIPESAADFAVGLTGITASFPVNTMTYGALTAAGSLVAGDVFKITATASKPNAIQTIVLQDNLPTTVAPANVAGVSNAGFNGVSLVFMYSAAEIEVTRKNLDPSVAQGSYNFTTDSDKVTVSGTLTVADAAGDYYPVYSANLSVEYRALLQEYTDTLYTITDPADLLTTLGPATAANPLALAVDMALKNSGGNLVYYGACPSDDLAGDLEVLKKASLTDKVYALCPATTEADRISALEAHVNALSQPEAKKWRTGCIGVEIPTEDITLDGMATITDDLRTSGTQYTKVTFETGADLLANAKVGYVVRYNFTSDAWGDAVWSETTVESVESNTVMYLAAGPAVPVNTAQRMTITNIFDDQEKADKLKVIGESYLDKRIFAAFPGNLGLDSGEYVSAYAGAAAIAGALSAIVPQRGMTNMEIKGISDIPAAYSTFSTEQLNTIASGGILIITQDTKNAATYIRHQITTAYADGNLNTAEISLVKNLDSISYYLGSVMDPYRGIYNISPTLIDTLYNIMSGRLSELQRNTAGELIGPQVLDGTEILTLEQHPTLKDRVYSRIKLELPKPFNTAELYLVV